MSFLLFQFSNAMYIILEFYVYNLAAPKILQPPNMDQLSKPESVGCSQKQYRIMDTSLKTSESPVH